MWLLGTQFRDKFAGRQRRCQCMNGLALLWWFNDASMMVLCWFNDGSMVSRWLWCYMMVKHEINANHRWIARFSVGGTAFSWVGGIAVYCNRLRNLQSIGDHLPAVPLKLAGTLLRWILRAENLHCSVSPSPRSSSQRVAGSPPRFAAGAYDDSRSFPHSRRRDGWCVARGRLRAGSHGHCVPEPRLSCGTRGGCPEYKALKWDLKGMNRS